jgi:hypothetical protein
MRLPWSLPRAILALAAAIGFAAAAGAKTPKPPPTRTAINTCDLAWLYIWPTDSALPVRAHFPPSHAGEQFELLDTVRYTLDGKGYYETTIPVISNSGSATHYWVSDACVNPPPLPAPKPSSSSRT